MGLRHAACVWSTGLAQVRDGGVVVSAVCASVFKIGSNGSVGGVRKIFIDYMRKSKSKSLDRRVGMDSIQDAHVV